jgi:hypothetical protein
MGATRYRIALWINLGHRRPNEGVLVDCDVLWAEIGTLKLSVDMLPPLALLLLEAVEIPISRSPYRF